MSRSPQWHYCKIDLSSLPSRTDDIDLLNAAGQDGWELITITANNFAYLKRMDAPAGEAKAATQATRRRAASTA